MREAVLRRFFLGEAAAADLSREVRRGVRRLRPADGPPRTRHHIEDMRAGFEVCPRHLASLVDAALAGDLTGPELEALAFCLESSDRFDWDSTTPEGARVANSLFWLASPEINHPLTAATLEAIRHYLLTGENPLTAKEEA